MAQGLGAIRRGQRVRHRRWMLSALGLQIVFAVTFVARLRIFGMAPFEHVGWLKAVYTVLIASHEALSVVTVPLVAATVALAWTARFREHRDIARFTFPIWMFVTLSGVLVYVFLYAIPWPASHT
jgi:putative membrane protein